MVLRSTGTAGLDGTGVYLGIDFGGSSFSCGIDVDRCRRDSMQRVLPSRARFSGLHTLNVPLRNGGSAGRWKRRNDLS